MTHLNGCVSKLLGNTECETPEFIGIRNTIVASADASGLTLQNVREGLQARGSHYIGVANTSQYTNLLILWQSSNDSRVPAQVGIALGSAEDSTVCLLDLSEQWRPRMDGEIIADSVTDYLSTTRDVVRDTATQIKVEKQITIDAPIWYRELIHGVREGYLLASKLGRSIDYLDYRTKANRHDAKNQEPTSPLSLYDLRSAMLRTLPSEGKKDSFNAVIARSMQIHRRLQDVASGWNEPLHVPE